MINYLTTSIKICGWPVNDLGNPNSSNTYWSVNAFMWLMHNSWVISNINSNTSLKTSFWILDIFFPLSCHMQKWGTKQKWPNHLSFRDIQLPGFDQVATAVSKGRAILLLSPSLLPIKKTRISNYQKHLLSKWSARDEN